MWDAWTDRRDECRVLAASIQAGVATASLPPELEDDEGRPEGAIVLTEHRRRERNSAVTRQRSSRCATKTDSSGARRVASQSRTPGRATAKRSATSSNATISFRSRRSSGARRRNPRTWPWFARRAIARYTDRADALGRGAASAARLVSSAERGAGELAAAIRDVQPAALVALGEPAVGEPCRERGGPSVLAGWSRFARAASSSTSIPLPFAAVCGAYGAGGLGVVRRRRGRGSAY